MKCNKTLKHEKGITMVAVVVTVIILLILAGVVINISLGDNGLLQKTKQAIEKYEEGQAKEEKALADLENQIKDLQKPKETVIDRTGIKVGDKVNYTPVTSQNTYDLRGEESGYGDYDEENYPNKLTNPKNQSIIKQDLDWKVLNVNDDLSVDIIGIPKQDNQVIYFQGALGYNNAVYLLNDICKTMYSNIELGVEARSVNVEDIESKMNSAGQREKEKSIEEQVKNAGWNTETLTGEFFAAKAYYPKLYRNQNNSGVDSDELKGDGIEESNDGQGLEDIEIPIKYKANEEQGYSQSTKLKVKHTLYSINQKAEYFKDEKYFQVFFQKGIGYWLASRCSNCLSNGAYFGIRSVGTELSLGGNSLMSSTTYSYSPNNHVAPIVSLKSNINLKQEKDGSWTPSKI